MKARYLILAALVIFAAASCRKEPVNPDPVDDRTLEFGFTVRNQDYAAEIVLKGVGEATLESADNLPSWVSGVKLKEDYYQGDPVAIFDVRADYNLEESRTARISLNMSTGAAVNVEITQWPLLQEKSNEILKSVNTQFEEDWASQKQIKLVISDGAVNGKPNIQTITRALPWAWDLVPVSYLPKGNGSDETMEVYKMIERQSDWSLIFNLTGINNLPNYNYFGLYNRYTGILRIFYYFTEEMVPDNNTNDHMWAFSVNADLAEHVATQFALPGLERATPSFKEMAAKPIFTSPLTDSFNPLSDGEKSVPAVGWWAFDVNLSAYRSHDFFNTRPRNAVDIHLCTYSEQKVFLNSVLQGSLSGNLQGNMNLELLRPSSTATWAKIALPILNTTSTLAFNTFMLKEVIGVGGGGGGQQQGGNQPQAGDIQINPLPVAGGVAQAYPARSLRPKSFAVAIGSLVVGVVCSLAGKYIDSFAKEKVKDDNFGALTANMNLDLNAVMTTQGNLEGRTPNKVPPAALSMDYLRETNPDGTPTCLGKGVWNLEKHPVIYVVKDAYWSENDFNVFASKVEYPLGNTDVYSYDLGGTKGSRPGLRLITFMDPTSIEGISFNEKLFDKQFDGLKILLSYGVYPGSTPGYTDAFRKAAGIDGDFTWRLSQKSEFKSAQELKLIKKPHTDQLFRWAGILPELAQIEGYRLSSQKLNAKYPTLERRFFGPSLYYANPYANDFTVDNVQFVYDPQIYLPFEDAAHKLYDPQIPDLVVTATMVAYGQDSKDAESSTLTNTLRFVPRIVLISYKDIPGIYDQIVKRKKSLHVPGVTTTFVDMEYQIQHIGDIKDAVSGK